MGKIHAPTQVTDRLQGVLDVLRDGKPHTTREILQRADVVAVNTCVSELRNLGYVIDCDLVSTAGDRRVHAYTLKSPKSQLELWNEAS